MACLFVPKLHKPSLRTLYDVFINPCFGYLYSKMIRRRRVRKGCQDIIRIRLILYYYYEKIEPVFTLATGACPSDSNVRNPFAGGFLCRSGENSMFFVIHRCNSFPISQFSLVDSTRTQYLATVLRQPQSMNPNLTFALLFFRTKVAFAPFLIFFRSVSEMYNKIVG